MGGVMGIFLSSFRYSDFNPANSMGQPLSEMPLRVQMKEALKDTYTSSFRTAKSFAKIGGLFATSECVIETVRAI